MLDFAAKEMAFLLEPPHPRLMMPTQSGADT